MSEAEIKVLAEEGKTKAVAAQATATDALDLAEAPVTQSAVENAATKEAYLEGVEEVRVRNCELLSIGNGG
jgi:hypothetical protein